MNLYFRFCFVVVAALFRRRLKTLDESVIDFRVWLTDLDVNLHMNNGRYLAIMDLGRIDLMLRTGLGRVALRRKWSPMVGSATIRFRRPLDPFQRFQLCSRILCWDDKWFFIEQRFERGGELIALGLIKGLLRGRERNIPTGEIFGALNIRIPSPEIPAYVRDWQTSEARMANSSGGSA